MERYLSGMSNPASRLPLDFTEPGPFRADQVPPKSNYELSDGHPILCVPTGGRAGMSQASGVSALQSDPLVDSAGVEVGYSPDGQTVRAPDVSVGNVPNAPGWVAGVPPLAVEYADTGKDEVELRRKIQELLRKGTKYVWVVRLTGPRLVEVHAPGQPMRQLLPGNLLEAPGILKNPVPVEALYDREVAFEATLQNLVQRRGYESFEAALAQSEERGKAEGEAAGKIAAKIEVLFRIIASRGWSLPSEREQSIRTSRDEALVDRWIDRALKAADPLQLFE